MNSVFISTLGFANHLETDRWSGYHYETQFVYVTHSWAEIANSISAGMDDIISTGDFEKRLLDEYKADTSKPNSTIRVARGNFCWV